MRRRTRGSLAGACVAAAAALAAAPLAVSGSAGASAMPRREAPLAKGAPIHVALIVSLTGPFAALGDGDVQGEKLAVDAINKAGGIQGHKVVVTVKNDESSPPQGAIVMQQEVSSGVMAVVGPVESGASEMAPIAERSHVPEIEITPAEQTVIPPHPYVYDVVPTGISWAQKTLQWLKAEHIHRVAFAYDTTEQFDVNGYNAMKADAARYGVKVVDWETFTATTTDFSAMLAHVKAAKPQALFIFAAGPAPVILTKQFAAAGLNKSIQLDFTGAEASYLYTKPSGAAANGVIISANDADLGSLLPAGAFKNEAELLIKPYVAKYHEQPPQFTVDCYAAFQALFHAMEHAHPLTSAGIEAQLEHTDLLTVDGLMDWNPKNHVSNHLNSLAMTVVENGRFLPTAWEKTQFGNLPR